MKKILLMLVAVTATMTMYAQAVDENPRTGKDDAWWTKSFAPVADAEDLSGLHTAVAADGSVYVSSTYKQAFTFAGKSVTDPDGLLSSCIVKYDKKGDELWSVSLVGACTVNAMAADADGTLYIAGRITDEKVVCTGVDGKKTEIVNPTSDPWGEGPQVDAYSAFIAKITTDGLFDAVKTISPTSASPIDLMNFDLPAVTPIKIVVDHNKVCMSCSFTGNVEELSWTGSYMSIGGWMAQNLKSYALVGCDKADLKNLVSGFTLQREPIVGTFIDGVQEDVQNAPDAFNFGIYDGTPVVMFVGWGKLKLTTGNTSKVFSFETSNDGTGMNEHAMVCVNGTAEKSQIFHAAKHDKSYVPYNLVGGEFADGNGILGGTFYGNFPLDTKVTREHNASFVASIKLSDCSVNWTVANEAESEATCMVVTGEEIHAAAQVTATTRGTETTTTGMVYHFKTADGSFLEADAINAYDAAQANDKYVSIVIADGAQVVVMGQEMEASGIEAIKAAAVNGSAKIYNLNGQRVAEPQKGLYIVNGRKVAIK